MIFPFILLVNDKEKLKLRIEKRKQREKQKALDNFEKNEKFLKENYETAIFINTENMSKEDVIEEVVQIVNEKTVDIENL